MRILNCSSQGCILKPKRMARTSQTGAGGVIQENTSKLYPLKSLRSLISKSASKKHPNKGKPKSAQTGKGGSPKSIQTGKGRRTHPKKVSVAPSVKSKTNKKTCAGKNKKLKTNKSPKTKNVKK